MGDVSQKPEVPEGLTVNGAVARSTNLLWDDRPAWFKVFFAWWLLPTVVVIWWAFIFGETMNRSTAEFNTRRAARDKDLRDRGLI